MMNVGNILHQKKKSDDIINAESKTEEQQEPAVAVVVRPRPEGAVVAAQSKPGCDFVPAAPPSELKYGDRLRLWVR